MKRTLCVVLTLICIFTFCSCSTNDTSNVLEETNQTISTSNQSIAPGQSIPEETSVEETTLKNEDAVLPEMPDIQLPIDQIIDKLSMFESVFQEESREWCMYEDIMGSAVTAVLAQRDLLIRSGCDEADILLAGQATENLRELLEEYNDLRIAEYESDDDKYIALYQYYAYKYQSLTQNFCNLYKTLKRLYENQKVSKYIGLMGKTEHYRQLVGHLYVVSTALDLNTERDEETWQIDGKPLHDVIEDVHYFPDGDWAPEGIY